MTLSNSYYSQSFGKVKFFLSIFSEFSLHAVETVHANLRWLMSVNHQSSRLARYILRLQEFDFTIQHKPGKANTNADALPRFPSNGTASQSSIDALLMAVTRDIFDRSTLYEIRSQQKDDPLLHNVIDFKAF